MTTVDPWPLVDRVAAYIGVWALRRLYGANCETDILDDFPGDTSVRCLSCDATRLVKHMREILSERNDIEANAKHSLQPGLDGEANHSAKDV